LRSDRGPADMPPKPPSAIGRIVVAFLVKVNPTFVREVYFDPEHTLAAMRSLDESGAMAPRMAPYPRIYENLVGEAALPGAARDQARVGRQPGPYRRSLVRRTPR
jgi:hypothetical protein